MVISGYRMKQLAVDHTSLGFTLIEVLLAMAMMALLFTMLYGTFGSTIDSIEAAEQECETYHMARLSIQQLYQELTSVVPSLYGTEFHAVERAECPQIMRVELVDDIEEEERGRGPRNPTEDGNNEKSVKGIGFVGFDQENDDLPVDCLAFATYAHGRYRPNTKESDLSVVTYWLDGMKLMHYEETNLFSLSEKSVESYPLAEGVESMSFRFFDGREWVDDWDARVEASLPHAVEVELTFRLLSEERRTFRTMIKIPRTSE